MGYVGLTIYTKRMFGLAVEEPENLVKPLLMENSPEKLEILSGVPLFNFQL